MLALAQVVVTVDALPEVTGICFLRDGHPRLVPRADGAIVGNTVDGSGPPDLLGPR